MSEATAIRIQKMIYVIRDQRVMLDSDLAELYGVKVKRLNEQVKRNIERFPDDFMFQLDMAECIILKSQIATSRSNWGGKRKQPLVFTENGVAMLSSILRSSHAVEVNIAIMRIFTKLRSYLLLEKDLTSRMDKLEEGTTRIFKTVFERLDDMDKEGESSISEKRKKIGLT